MMRLYTANPTRETGVKYHQTRISNLITPFVLMLFLSALFLGFLGRRDLISSHEARAAQNAQRMLDTGEWGLPVLYDGQTDLQKPPGYYWLVAAGGWFNSGEVNALVTRFPAALAGLATVLTVYLFLLRQGRPTAAMIAAITLATAIHFTAIARTARIDVPLTCAITAALIALHCGLKPGAPRLRWHFAAGVAAAAGVMLKGPLALALLGPVALISLLKQPSIVDVGRPTWNSRLYRITSLMLGAATVMLLACPWFLWANHATQGEFFEVFFWHHNVERFTGQSATLASHPWWYYLPRFAVDFLPWSPAFGLLAVWAVRSDQWRKDPLLRFGLLWFGVMFALLSLAKFKRSDYLLPLYPGAAIALGCAAESWLATRTMPCTVRRVKRAFALVLGLVVIGWPVMIFAIEPAAQAGEEKRAFATEIRTHAPQPHTILFFRTESHLLAFHLGRPLYTFVEWKELNDLLAEPGLHFVVMPAEYVYPAQEIVTSRRLAVVARLDDFTKARPHRPLVFLRTAD